MPSLPTYVRPILSSYNETWDESVLRFTPDTGPPTTRKLTNYVSIEISFDAILTTAEAAGLKDFYLANRNEVITLSHPGRDSTTFTGKFSGPPQVRPVGAGGLQVTLRLRSLPATGGL